MRAMFFFDFFLKRARREGPIRLIEIENGHENVNFMKNEIQSETFQNESYDFLFFSEQGLKNDVDPSNRN